MVALAPLSMILIVVVVAHYQATIHPKTRLLHCDISGSNILILPQIRRDKNGKNPMVVWTGVLSDWEFAVHLRGDSDAPGHCSCSAKRGTCWCGLGRDPFAQWELHGRSSRSDRRQKESRQQQRAEDAAMFRVEFDGEEAGRQRSPCMGCRWVVVGEGHRRQDTDQPSVDQHRTWPLWWGRLESHGQSG